MSYKTKAEAVADAKASKTKMPRGWKIRVWENLGWHWELQRGPLRVRPYPAGFFGGGRKKGFTASVCEDTGGQYFWSDVFGRPAAAVKDTLAKMRRWMAKQTEQMQVTREAAEAAATGVGKFDKGF